MRLISNKALTEFAAKHIEADAPLQAWRKIIETGAFSNYAELKNSFNATDKVGDYYVFDIGGNKYRVISAIHFNRQMVFIRHVFTHQEYDKWKP
ncbi:type II toxin-antitoxin system HigB family toxin [Variovorax sp. ZT4R33]|uniref:type II toxin-antitoxin system HigB family toxin n=1 Tax=Variovorax sp. ZT4R33 TaxID=3443743 RepID=UPI003F446BB9